MAQKTPVQIALVWPCGSCLFDCALSRGAAVSQIRDNSQMCSLSRRPQSGSGDGGRKRVHWDPVLPNPALPLATPGCGPHPKGSGRDRARRLWSPLPSHLSPLLQSSEHPVGVISNYLPHPTKPFLLLPTTSWQPIYLSSRRLQSAHYVPGTMLGAGRHGWIKLDPCPKELTALWRLTQTSPSFLTSALYHLGTHLRL